MFESILVICTGNICRSPIGERLLRSALPNKKIDSAGTGALVNHKADSSAIRVAEKHNLSLEGHRGKQFTSDLGHKYDLILVMERYHLEQVSSMAPEVRGKTMLFGHWINGQDIPDPYRKSDEVFELVYNLISKASLSWAKHLDI